MKTGSQNTNKINNIAFTLVELLVVIAIVGILSGLIIVGMSSSVQSANIARGQVFSNSLRDSLLMSLVSEWKFDGPTAIGSPATNSDVLDTWGAYNYNGDITGHAPTVRGGSSCIRNDCLEFDGLTSYITFGDVLRPDRANNRTLEAWVYPHALSTETIFTTGNLTYSKSGYSDFAINNATTLRISYDFNITPYAANVNCPTDLNKWNYFAFSVDISDPVNVTIKIYKNGQYIDQTTQERTTVAQYNTTFQIGAETSGSSPAAPIRFFDGLIDEARIYKASIPASQIKENYFVGLNKLLLTGQMLRDEYLQRVVK